MTKLIGVTTFLPWQNSVNRFDVNAISPPHNVIPANAGIYEIVTSPLGESRMRRNDKINWATIFFRLR